MGTSTRLMLTVCALVLAGPAAAQRLSPGLWEHSVTMKGAGGEMAAAMAKMQKEMAAMPPEQRKMMQDMMARQGMRIGSTDQTMAVKTCITPDQAARDQVPPPDGNCRMTSQERSGNTLRVKFECTGEHKGSGEGEYTFISDKAHKGRTVITTTVKGKPERIEIDHTGRWLAADCGTIKPMQ
jgi:hypothetical protein